MDSADNYFKNPNFQGNGGGGGCGGSDTLESYYSTDPETASKFWDLISPFISKGMKALAATIIINAIPNFVSYETNLYFDALENDDFAIIELKKFFNVGQVKNFQELYRISQERMNFLLSKVIAL